MWIIRVLTGPQAGKVVQLKSGKNRLGRAPSCEIRINDQGISKEHLELRVFVDKVLISDLKSSNGTFVNGVRVQNSLVRHGDKIGVYNLLFELLNLEKSNLAQDSRGLVAVGSDLQHVPANSAGVPDHAAATQAPPPAIPQTFSEKFNSYSDRVIMPSIYRSAEVFDFKVIFFGFALAFVFMVTVLSVIPMKQITIESTQIESRRRALTVARALALANEKIIRNGDLSNFSTDFVLREDGIEDVFIIGKTGHIISPPERAGARPSQVSFVTSVLGQIREVTGDAGVGQVGAAYPIVSFDSELQQNVPRAYAVVIFNTGSLQYDDGRAFSLFIQMLVIACLLGTIIFFLLYKLIENPWTILNKEIDQAIRESRDSIRLDIKFQPIQNLLVNLNSLLVRAMNPQSVSGQEVSNNRDPEMKNICDLIGFPALIFNRGGFIVGCNSAFEQMSNIQAGSILGQTLKQLPDQALQKNIEGLTAQAVGQTGQTFSDTLEMSGQPLKISGQAISSGAKNEVDYMLITFMPMAQGEGEAA